MNTKNPNHYSRWSIEPIEFIRANRLDFARANIIKYIMRYDAKDGMKDLDKAQQYMDWLREDFAAKFVESLPVMDIAEGEEDWIVAERALYDRLAAAE